MPLFVQYDNGQKGVRKDKEMGKRPQPSGFVHNRKGYVFTDRTLTIDVTKVTLPHTNFPTVHALHRSL